MTFRSTLLSILGIVAALFVALYFTFSINETLTQAKNRLESHSANTLLLFDVDEQGFLTYTAIYHSDTILQKSRLYLQTNQGIVGKSVSIEQILTRKIDENIPTVWGEIDTISWKAREALILLKDAKKRKFQIRFICSEDGFAFRYEFPEWKDTLRIVDEYSEFNLKGDPYCWWIPANFISDEELYNSTPLSEIREIILSRSYKGNNELYMKNVADSILGCNTPFTCRTSEGNYLSIHEAAQVQYSDMMVKPMYNGAQYTLRSTLVPATGSMYRSIIYPRGNTPWRCVLTATHAKNLLTNQLIFNLNEPNKITDALSWCKPIRYIGIWWGYHIGKWSWDPGQSDKEHGATTLRAKQYIDFAQTHGIEGLLIEGWNSLLDTAALQAIAGSSGDYPKGWRSYTQGHSDFNLEEVAAYAQDHNVQLILLCETMGETSNFESQMEEAFSLYEKLGIHYVKVGHAWYIQKGKYFHKEQSMIEYHMRVLECARRHKINIVAHESNEDTGLRRTYPNYMTREAVRGVEYNAWDKALGNPPEHETILPFTRCLAGPIDYTPGIFDLTFDQYKLVQRVNTTKAKQLALYVVLYSPMVMAADLIENYENDSAFAWIKAVPATWNKTVPIDASIGNYVVVARKNKENWYVGGITDENARTLTVKFDFLPPNTEYEATLYADHPDTKLQSNPGKIRISTRKLTSTDSISIECAESGGFAMQLTPLYP